MSSCFTDLSESLSRKKSTETLSSTDILGVKGHSDLMSPRKGAGKTAPQSQENANRTQECRATYSTWLLFSPTGISTLLLLCLPLVESVREGGGGRERAEERNYSDGDSGGEEEEQQKAQEEKTASLNHCTLHSPHTQKALASMQGKRGIINKMPNSAMGGVRKIGKLF